MTRNIWIYMILDYSIDSFIVFITCFMNTERINNKNTDLNKITFGLERALEMKKLVNSKHPDFSSLVSLCRWCCNSHCKTQWEVGRFDRTGFAAWTPSRKDHPVAKSCWESRRRVNQRYSPWSWMLIKWNFVTNYKEYWFW